MNLSACPGRVPRARYLLDFCVRVVDLKFQSPGADLADLTGDEPGGVIGLVGANAGGGAGLQRPGGDPPVRTG